MPAKILRARTRLGLSQEQFSKLLGVTAQAVCAAESGKYRWTPLTVARWKMRLRSLRAVKLEES